MTRLYFSLTILLLTSRLFAQDNAATQRLTEQSKQFEEQIIKVADKVHVAVGFSPANVSMIEGDDGLVIVDTGMSVDDGTRIMEEFRKLSDKPVKAIIFTHSHGDHTGGTTAFFGAERPQIWAHINFGSEARPWKAGGLTYQNVRGARQAGFKLPREQRINNGVAPARSPKRGGEVFASAKEIVPTHFLEGDRKAVKVGGVEFEIVASPGETNDEVFVWYPAGKVLFAGDNFYRSFPNLYAIRGTPNRSTRLWAESLGKMIGTDPEALVGGHTNPIIGAEKVKQVLTDYRDAVQFIHDKTVEGINKGLTPDELVEYVQLPEELAGKDYLQPFYGHPDWGVRTTFNYYLGWFDGNPSNLFPLPPKAEAERMAKLAGGKDKLIAAAKAALADDDNQWAAQLADHLLALDKSDAGAKQIKADALTKLARKMVNATARNYYLTVARELREEPKPEAKQGQSGLKNSPSGSAADRANKASTNSGSAKVSLGQEANSGKVKESFPKEKSLNATTSMMQLQLYAIFTTPNNGIAPMMEVLEEHLDYQRKIEKDGILFGAGPFWTTDEKSCEGEGMIIVRAANITEAQKIADADPMHAKGARSYVVRPWLLNEGRLTIQLDLSSRKADLK